MDHRSILEGMERAARLAGAVIREAKDIREGITAKEGHANFVTLYDKRVQDLLFGELSRVCPQARMMGEEEGGALADLSGLVFCIDPIDGTTNFIMGYGSSATSIALLQDGEPVIGLIYDPYLDRMFTAIRGQGAWRNGEPIRSSDRPLSESLVVFGTSVYDPSLYDQTLSLCGQYMRAGIDLRRSGSCAVDLCNVAEGTAGFFFEMRLQLWDFAAGGLICREAGCVLTDAQGQPLRYEGPSSVFCASRGVAAGKYLPGDL